MKRRLFRAATAAAAWLLLVNAAPAAEPLRLGVVPQMPAPDIQRHWQPVAQWLQQACGVSIDIDIPPSIPGFEQRFSAGAYDLAYMNPYHAVMARQAQGYEPLVRDDSQRLSGVLVVKRDGPVRRVADLAGKTIAFPAPNAFGASLYMRALLQNDFGLKFTADYVRTHSSAYRQVLTGEAAAAGGIGTTLQREPPHVRDALEVIYHTPAVAPHPLAAHPRLPTPVRDCVVRTLTATPPDAAQQQLLRNVQMPEPVRADYARDYLPLQRLQLEAFVVR